MPALSASGPQPNLPDTGGARGQGRGWWCPVAPDPQQAEPESAPARRSPAHYLGAVRIARTYEVFPRVCPICGGQMRLIAFITEGAEVRKILEYIGVDACGGRCNLTRARPLHFLVSDLPNLALLDANVMIAQGAKAPYLASCG